MCGDVVDRLLLLQYQASGWVKSNSAIVSWQNWMVTWWGSSVGCTATG